MDELNGDDAPRFTREEHHIERAEIDELNRATENGAAELNRKEHHVESGEFIPHNFVPQMQEENKRQRTISRLISKDWFETRSIAVFTSGGDSQGNLTLILFTLSK